MIIQRIRSQNFLKYRNLQMNDLPADGIIAISGANESGKTAIVETITFGLFGRTFQLDESNCSKAVLWGETDGEVELVFTGNDGKSYTILRTIDTENRSSVRLSRTENDTILCKGVAAVTEQVTHLCGFDYNEFVDSIYLAQKDAASHHPKQSTAGAITGVSRLQQLAEQFQQTITENKREIAEIVGSIGDVITELRKLDLETDSLLSQAADKPDPSQRQRLTEGVERAAAVLQQDIPQLQIAMSQFGSLTAQSSINHWKQMLSSLEQLCEHMRTELLSDEHQLLQPVKAAIEELQQRIQPLQILADEANGYRQALKATLEPSAEGETDSLPQQLEVLEESIEKSSSQRTVRKSIGWLFALVAIVGAAAWYMVTKQPEHQLSQQISQQLGEHLQYLLPFVGGAAVVALLFWMMAAGSSSSVRRQEQQRNELQQTIDITRAQQSSLSHIYDLPLFKLVDTVTEIDSPELNDRLQQITEGSSGDLLDQEKCQAVISDFHSCCSKLQEDLTIEADRLHRGVEHYRIAFDMQDQIGKIYTDSQTRSMAIELLLAASRQTMERFNLDLKKFVSRVMPQLTEDRYHYLQLQQNLDISIFSRDKHDFVRWEEISTGTQQQVLLSLRLALVAAMAECGAEQSKQCVILDEPFAFYDASRLDGSIAALPGISPRLSQFWILSQEFRSNEPFVLHIATDRNSDEMVIAGA